MPARSSPQRQQFVRSGIVAQKTDQDVVHRQRIPRSAVIAQVVKGISQGGRMASVPTIKPKPR